MAIAYVGIHNTCTYVHVWVLYCTYSVYIVNDHSILLLSSTEYPQVTVSRFTHLKGVFAQIIIIDVFLHPSVLQNEQQPRVVDTLHNPSWALTRDLLNVCELTDQQASVVENLRSVVSSFVM